MDGVVSLRLQCEWKMGIVCQSNFCAIYALECTIQTSSSYEQNITTFSFLITMNFHPQSCNPSPNKDGLYGINTVFILSISV